MCLAQTQAHSPLHVWMSGNTCDTGCTHGPPRCRENPSLPGLSLRRCKVVETVVCSGRLGVGRGGGRRWLAPGASQTRLRCCVSLV